jgi:hypothetical protein
MLIVVISEVVAFWVILFLLIKIIIKNFIFII